jgi:hypothetical protein
MPGKTARSAARQPLGLPKVTAAAHATRPSCQNAGKAQNFAPLRGSYGESRLSSRKGRFMAQYGLKQAVPALSDEAELAGRARQLPSPRKSLEVCSGSSGGCGAVEKRHSREGQYDTANLHAQI